MPTSAGKHYHHKDLRAALIGATLDLLAEDGADAVSLRAVARKAGVSAMAPYRHYPNKEALLAAVAVQGFEALHAALERADSTAAPGQALVEQAVAYVAFALSHPAMFRQMFGPKRLDPHPELTAAGEAAYGVLARRVAAESSAQVNPEARALGCWSMVHGMALLLLDGRIHARTATPPDDMIRRVAGAMFGV